MKTRLKNLLYTGLIGLATLTATVAGNTSGKPVTGWITSSDVAFKIRLIQTHDNLLMIQVQNPNVERLWLNLRTLDGEDVFHLTLPEHQTNHQIRFDISHLHDGPYRVEVVSGINKVATVISLTPSSLDASEPGSLIAHGELINE